MRVRNYESSIVRRFDVVFAVSQDDRVALEGLGARSGSVGLLPNIPQEGLLDRPELQPPGEPTLLFLGTLGWPPNAEGLRRFLRSGLPLLRSRRLAARPVVALAGTTRRPAPLTAQLP